MENKKSLPISWTMDDEHPAVRKYFFSDDGLFPNNLLPVLHYPQALNLPVFLPGSFVWKLFAKNDWGNYWKNGIFTFHHYHSNTHEVMGIVSGETTLLLGGWSGAEVRVRKGDVLILPAGTAHKNLGKQRAVTCIGAYPQSKNYDMCLGDPADRPQADKNIRNVKLPVTDPVYGKLWGLIDFWG